jgi:hypothetical protein
MASRRKFSDEYKREAVQLATQRGVTKSQIARELGINANMLGRWCALRWGLITSASTLFGASRHHAAIGRGGEPRSRTPTRLGKTSG